MMSSSTTDATNTACANCGKAESDDVKFKRCTACKMAKYCCRDCQVSHRPHHKKACKKRAAEIFEEELFKDPPERPECPICMLPLPFNENHVNFNACCGKLICLGCVHAQIKEELRSGKNRKDCGACEFCRTPGPTTDKDVVDRINICVKRNDAPSLHHLATLYMDGAKGLQKNLAKAMELFLKSGELGFPDAYDWLGNIYRDGGDGVERNLKKARYYYELGAIGGSIYAIYNLALLEKQAGTLKRASKHFLICAKAGYEISLKQVKHSFEEGYITKDEYTEALRAYQKQHEDTKSEMRDEALVYEANPLLYRRSF